MYSAILSHNYSFDLSRISLKSLGKKTLNKRCLVVTCNSEGGVLYRGCYVKPAEQVWQHILCTDKRGEDIVSFPLRYMSEKTYQRTLYLISQDIELILNHSIRL